MVLENVFLFRRNMSEVLIPIFIIQVEFAGASKAIQVQICTQKSLPKNVFRTFAMSDDAEHPLSQYSAISMA
jgi:hypothetical protein